MQKGPVDVKQKKIILLFTRFVKNCSMKLFIQLFCFLFILSSCGGGDKKAESKTYEDAKETLEEKEKKQPLEFLSVSGADKKNLFGQTVITGKVKNKATVCAYKNIRIKMVCFKEGRQVEEHEDVLKESLQPNNSNDFKTRYRLPKGTDSVALSVMSASVK